MNDSIQWALCAFFTIILLPVFMGLIMWWWEFVIRLFNKVI